MKKIILPIFLLMNFESFSQIEKKGLPKPINYSAKQDHQQMMNQLGIKKLRPGANGNESAPNHANYDEAFANPFPDLPDLMYTKRGENVITADIWWNKKRPEIVDEFESEVYGRIPKNVPKVNWEVKIVDREFVGRTPVIAKQLIGHVENATYPLIEVNINMVLVTPLNVKGPVPVLMMFGRPSLPAPAQPDQESLERLNVAIKNLMLKADPGLLTIFQKYPAYNPIQRSGAAVSFGPPPTQSVEISPTEQLLNAGWGYATIDPNSIQQDNGAGLTRGIIGLVNQGQPRKPDDWGALRAWAWGAGRGLDYLEKDSAVDVSRVGIEGVSRFGKAALVTMAFDKRFATGLIGSSGKGGATLHRRNWGEAVENLTGGEYYWMAGNYMKYGADESVFGRKTADDLPVDSHGLIALCAPRPVFISYGIPEKGDAKWLDQLGSFKATVAAGTVYKLLGAKDLGLSNDYKTEKMPPYNTSLLDGNLAWRQHDGGHTDAPNMKYFIQWANGKFSK